VILGGLQKSTELGTQLTEGSTLHAFHSFKICRQNPSNKDFEKSVYKKVNYEVYAKISLPCKVSLLYNKKKAWSTLFSKRLNEKTETAVIRPTRKKRTILRIVGTLLAKQATSPTVEVGAGPLHGDITWSGKTEFALEKVRETRFVSSSEKKFQDASHVRVNRQFCKLLTRDNRDR